MGHHPKAADVPPASACICDHNRPFAAHNGGSSARGGDSSSRDSDSCVLDGDSSGIRDGSVRGGDISAREMCDVRSGSRAVRLRGARSYTGVAAFARRLSKVACGPETAVEETLEAGVAT